MLNEANQTRKISVCCFVILFITCINLQQPIYATSWVDLPAEEVIERAEVVIQGTYDFTSDPHSGMMYQGYEFQVSKAYKGEVQQNLIVGIDGFSIGLADEFQQQKGEFLLFLEKDDAYDFLIPVAGPNGMIQISNGKVQHHDEEETAYFTNYLIEQEEIPFDDSYAKGGSGEEMGLGSLVSFMLL